MEHLRNQLANLEKAVNVMFKADPTTVMLDSVEVEHENLTTMCILGHLSKADAFQEFQPLVQEQTRAGVMTTKRLLWQLTNEELEAIFGRGCNEILFAPRNKGRHDSYIQLGGVDSLPHYDLALERLNLAMGRIESALKGEECA